MIGLLDKEVSDQQEWSAAGCELVPHAMKMMTERCALASKRSIISRGPTSRFIFSSINDKIFSILFNFKNNDALCCVLVGRVMLNSLLIKSSQPLFYIRLVKFLIGTNYHIT